MFKFEVGKYYLIQTSRAGLTYVVVHAVSVSSNRIYGPWLAQDVAGKSCVYLDHDGITDLIPTDKPRKITKEQYEALLHLHELKGT